MSLTSPDLMKQNNKNTILEMIYKHENIYRAQIADMTNMSNQTITNLVKELLADGLLQEVRLEKKSKGRNPMALSIAKTTRYVVGVELSVKGIKVSIYDLNFDLLSTEMKDLSSDNMAVLKEMMNHQLDAFERSHVCGIAVSVEGIVDESTGLIIKSKDLGLNGKNILNELAYLGVPVHVRNDVNMLAETDSKKHHERNYMLVKLDCGIGAALVTDGRVLHSAKNAAGELGHMTIYGLESPEECKCGKVGCLTTIASATAIENRTSKTLFELKKDYDQGVEETVLYLDSLIEFISKPLANLITFLDLESIILTGNVVDTFRDEFNNQLDKRLRNKLSHWLAFDGFEILDHYDMTERCARCAIENFFINGKGEGELPSIT